MRIKRMPTDEERLDPSIIYLKEKGMSDFIMIFSLPLFDYLVNYYIGFSWHSNRS
jgi:hypothetical protein